MLVSAPLLLPVGIYQLYLFVLITMCVLEFFTKRLRPNRAQVSVVCSFMTWCQKKLKIEVETALQLAENHSAVYHGKIPSTEQFPV